MEAGITAYAGLVLAWAGYFALHSLLAARRIKAAVVSRWPHRAGSYRMAYNLLAVALLIPLLALTVALDGPMVLVWQGPSWWLAQALALAAVAGFLVSLRGYDMGHFLGLRQHRTGAITDGGVEPWEPLRLSGFHRFVRHPWYCFGLVILWTRDLHLAGLVSAAAVTAYLVVGSRLEERKLVATYGAAYRAYRRRVPGLLPLPGRHLSPAEAAELARQANADSHPSS
jgi:protein-S-isoprenylcysteine O-methyltransferase Ste14